MSSPECSSETVHFLAANGMRCALQPHAGAVDLNLVPTATNLPPAPVLFLLSTGNYEVCVPILNDQSRQFPVAHLRESTGRSGTAKQPFMVSMPPQRKGGFAQKPCRLCTPLACIHDDGFVYVLQKAPPQ